VTDPAVVGVDDAAEEAAVRQRLRGPEQVPLGCGSMISDHLVELALSLVDGSGVCQEITAWRDEDRARCGKGLGGRPATLDDRTVLAVLVLLALDNTPLLVTRMADLVACRISDKSRQLLGITGALDADGWYSRLWRALHRTLDVIDPYPIRRDLGGDRRSLLTKEQFDAVVGARDPEDQQRKQARLTKVSDSLLQATVALVPCHIRRRWKGNTCIDATLIAAFGKRGNTKSSLWHSIEPDAGWYTREEDHSDGPDSKGRKRPRVSWGWEAHIAMMTINTSGDSDFPFLALGVSFDKPGHRVGENARGIYDSIAARGHPRGIAVGDRAYFPGARPDKLQLPLKALGFGYIGDFRSDQLGQKGGHEGAIQVEGGWYCPSMPQSLIDATIDYQAGRIDKAAWQSRIEQRSQYAFRQKAKPDKDGYRRLMCPASFTATCPAKPAKDPSGRTRIPVAPANPGRVCEQQSVTFPPSAGAKYEQSIPFGTQLWERLYRNRNGIEGLNGNIKDGNREAVDDPERRRVRGHTAQHVLVTVLLAGANLRRLDVFLARSDTRANRPRTRAPRRRDRLNNYLDVPGPAKDPPAA